MKNKLTLLALSMILVVSAQAQDNPIRIGLKLGKPNIAGLSAEYALPFIGGRLAPSLEYSFIPIKVDFIDPEVTYTYFGFGTNFYFLGDGKGPYAHIGYGRIGIDATFTQDGEEGEASLDANLFNVKLGIRKGKRVYFLSEIGYGFGKGDSEVQVQYSNQTRTEKIPAFLVGGLVVNTGFGIAF